MPAQRHTAAAGVDVPQLAGVVHAAGHEEVAAVMEGAGPHCLRVLSVCGHALALGEAPQLHGAVARSRRQVRAPEECHLQ